MNVIYPFSGSLLLLVGSLCINFNVIAVESGLITTKGSDIGLSSGVAGMPTNPDLVGTSTLTLDKAVQLSVQDNPGLAEMQARASAMAAIPSQAGTLPDPIVSFNTLNLPVDSFDTGQVAMTQLQFGISQRLPFPGKLGLREEIARHVSYAAVSDVDELRLILIRDVKKRWWRLFYHDRALQIVSANQELLRQFVEIAQTKYKVGQGLQQDVLLAQLELSKLLDQEIQLKGNRRSEAARLNALLDQPTDSSVVLPTQVMLDLPNLLSEPVLLKLAETTRPVLTKRQQLVNAAKARRDLAEKNLMPDFNVGAWYGFRDGNEPDGSSRSDFLSMKFSMNIPIFSDRKQRKAIDQRNSELLQSTYSKQDEYRNVQKQISIAIADYLRAQERFSLFKTGIIPQAQQTVASMLAAYQVNKVDFLNLVGAQITLFNYETRYWQALSNANSALAELSAAIGKETIYE